MISLRYRAGIAGGIADIAGFAEVLRRFRRFRKVRTLFVPDREQGIATRKVLQGIARYRKVSRVILYARHWLHEI